MPVNPIIELNWEIVEEALASALSNGATTAGDFYHDFRQGLRTAVAARLSHSGIDVDLSVMPQCTGAFKDGRVAHILGRRKATGWGGSQIEELDSDFCLKYGFDDSSLTALNYLDRSFCELPSVVPFCRVEGFSVGNLLFAVQMDVSQLRVAVGNGLHLAGYALGRTPKGRRSYLGLLGMWFDTAQFSSLVSHQNLPCIHSYPHLDEIRIGTVRYPMMWICRRCGALFTCSCFDGHFSLPEDTLRFLPYGNSGRQLREHVQDIAAIDSLCHLCNGGHPRLDYGHEMYYSGFLQKHLPYFTLFCRQAVFQERWYTEDEFIRNSQRFPQTVPGTPEWDQLNAFFEKIRQEQEAFKRRIENKTREIFGFSHVGEKWRQETELFHLVDSLLEDIEVVHHYRGAELEGQELDIWVPSLTLGIEYHGEQHFMPIQHFGGKRALDERRKMDDRKRKRCAELGYDLVEFRFDQDLSEEAVCARLFTWLNRRR